MTSKKDKILQIALELFTEQGFSATTTKEIALKSGVAEGLIFYHFKDKNELLNQLIRKFSFIGSISDESINLSQMEPIQALLKLGHLYADFLSQHKSFLFFIWSPEMVQNKSVNKELADLFQSMSTTIAIQLERAVSDRADEQKIELASSMLLSTILTHVIVGERVSEGSFLEKESHIKEIINLILKGFHSD